jgi:hypothetical protein
MIGVLECPANDTVLAFYEALCSRDLLCDCNSARSVRRPLLPSTGTDPWNTSRRAG